MSIVFTNVERVSDQYGNIVEIKDSSGRMLWMFRRLVSITVTTAPGKTVYNHGDAFDKTGMVVTATYTDDTQVTVTSYTVTNGSSLNSNGQTSVTISYTENGVTKTATTPVTVKKVLSSIAVTTAPSKTTYNHGETFDKTGMVVTATYTDGTKAAITGYTISNGSLATGQTSVTISYTENGITKVTTQAIKINVPTAMLYSDRTLVFQMGDAVDSSHGSLVASYTGFENTVFTPEAAPEWLDKNLVINSVLFADSFAVVKPISTAYWFYDLYNVTTWDFTNLNTSNVAGMEYMFYNSSITGEGLSTLKVLSATDMTYMFCECDDLISADLRGWNTANVTCLGGMFYNCRNLTTLNLSGWDNSSVETMAYMFYGCNKMTTIDLTGFKTNNVTATHYMFYDCDDLTTLDLSSFNTARVTNMKSMFALCSSLTTIYASERWSVSAVTDSSGMFSGCINLRGAISYQVNKVDKTHANYTSGYLTYKSAA